MGTAALTVCSTAFHGLGRAQATALGYGELPIALIPHPFGILARDEVRELARQSVDGIVRLACHPDERQPRIEAAGSKVPLRAAMLHVPGEQEALDRYFSEHKWTDGLPAVAPTVARVERMLRATNRAPDEVISTIAPRYGSATVERIAINAVLAGCYPEYLPVLIAATEAMAAREFHLQSVQATTNPAAVMLIVNGPISQRLGLNSGSGCLGPGAWANATLGRALRLILQNIGGALPGQVDRATHGQPGKYTFCCAENEAANPWSPLHVERGYARDVSTVTVVAPLGTWNMNTHAKDSDDLLRVIADTMAFPAGSDYTHAGEPWLVLCPEHAHILQREGLEKAEVKRRLWEQSKMSAGRLAKKDLGRVQNDRQPELGSITRETLLPISVKPDDIGILVAGGDGTHSVYLPVSGHSRSVTRRILPPA